jgi:hypothetical protein
LFQGSAKIVETNDTLEGDVYDFNFYGQGKQHFINVDIYEGIKTKGYEN